MHSKDNLEEFFKNTINEFNDIPSDNVWIGVEQGLEPQQKQHIFNHKLLLPFLMVCLVTLCTFSLIRNINLHQKTEILTAKMQEKQNELDVLRKNLNDVKQRYLQVEDYVENKSETTPLYLFSQEYPLRGDDVISIREL